MEVKIERLSRYEWKIQLDGLNIANSVRRFDFEGDANSQTGVLRLELNVDEIEITAMGESDDTIIVNIPRDTERTLQALGWVKTSDRTTYTRPREDPLS